MLQLTPHTRIRRSPFFDATVVAGGAGNVADGDATGFAQALAAARVVDAVLRSCESGGWEEV